ncbi:MAG: bifunctional 5,10-methylenetetrahydrofolate dehydrogenase/5,10-methenyltetrahydrofolate cyclohydrolase [Candidatus Magasanikbacteria bacterium]|nr:bifunctional 5,10-methylenetetrahydrofolate dehydrogenase/5,10-methenyltetrahydrofolate cyclohydrolase [Candidatus Magasanikbacteria bacterium]
MILSGTALSEEMLALVQNTVAESGLTPRLAVIQVGSDAASDIYVSLKSKIAARVGIALEKFHQDSATTEQLIELIHSLNERADVDAILVQLPLPAGIDTDAIISAIDPKKDVDGFHPKNIGAYVTGQAVHTPVLLQAIEWLLGKTGEKFSGKQAVVVGKSDVFLQPLSYLLAFHGMQVSEIKPAELSAEKTRDADVLIVATGKPKTITADMVKDGAIVIDIGINRLDDGKIVGDVDFESVQQKAAWITPTPGGVGPVTIAALMWNTLRLALDRS